MFMTKCLLSPITCLRAKYEANANICTSKLKVYEHYLHPCFLFLLLFISINPSHLTETLLISPCLTAFCTLPFLQYIHHSLKVSQTIFSLHVHQNTVRCRLYWHMQKGVYSRMVQNFSDFLLVKKENYR